MYEYVDTEVYEPNESTCNAICTKSVLTMNTNWIMYKFSIRVAPGYSVNVQVCAHEYSLDLRLRFIRLLLRRLAFIMCYVYFSYIQVLKQQAEAVLLP